MLLWQAQGEICDRTQEVLGRTDVPITFMRRQLEEQISLVEDGKTPLNVFAQSPDIIVTATPDPPADIAVQTLGYRGMYHKGFGTDDSDRYGPAFELVKDLHRRIEAAGIAAREAAGAGTDTAVV